MSLIIDVSLWVTVTAITWIANRWVALPPWQWFVVNAVLCVAASAALQEKLLYVCRRERSHHQPGEPHEENSPDEKP